MKPLNVVFNLFLFAVLFLGLYLFASDPLQSPFLYENMDTSANPCPDMLIHKKGKLSLYLANTPIKKGVNPLEFQHLDEYTTYYNKQKNAGVSCPLLLDPSSAEIIFDPSSAQNTNQNK